jgi:Tfp pilus assembly protein PilO
MSTGPNPKFFGILLGTSVVFGLALNYFAYTKVAGAGAMLLSVKKDQEKARMVPQMLKESAAKLADSQAELKHLESGIPDVAYMPTMLKELETLGNTCGMQVTAVRPVPVNDAQAKENAKNADKPYQPMDIEIHGVGHYGDALRFIRALDTFPKIVSAVSVSLDPQGGKFKTKVGSPSLEMVIQLRAFVFKTQTNNRTAMNGKGDNHA